MRTLLALLILLITAFPAMAQRFSAVAFHDVVDDEKDLTSDGITTGRLIGFLDWLRGNGWTPVSLDDIAAAGHGSRPLPSKSILLTFDDGYRSAYTRVYPLLLAYHYPAVFALVGAWMDAPENATVDYAGTQVPRSRFLSWPQAREMAASGLAEFASHTYDLHHAISANPLGGMTAAATTWGYDQATSGYETDAELRTRVLKDLQRSSGLMREHLGGTPRALAWPFGRYSGPARAAALQAGFSFALTLDAEPADAAQPMAIPRLYPSRNPTLASLIEGVRFDSPGPVTRRVVCLSMDRLANDAVLGTTIEAVRRLGANTVVLDPGAEVTDMLRFAAWQMRTRGDVEMFLRIDPRADSTAIRALVRIAPIDGVLIDPAGNLIATGDTPPSQYPWIVRVARERVDIARLDAAGRQALDAWHAAADERPGLRLALTAPPQPEAAPSADWLLTDAPVDDLRALAQRLAERDWLTPSMASRVVLPVIGRNPPAAIRAAQRFGATGFSLCPAPKLPAESSLAAAFSAATFPRLP